MSERKHKTSINLLKLPIFGTKKKKISDRCTVEYEEKGVKKKIRITGKLLTNFDRKLLLACEVLYLKQGDTDFTNNTLVTSYKQLHEVLGLETYAHGRIANSLDDMASVTFYADIEYKDHDGTVNYEHLAYHIFDSVHAKGKKTQKKKEYATTVTISFNNYYLLNLRNRYYRIINFELVKRLSTKSVRLFDYLNLNCYFKDRKDGLYKQRKNIKIRYEKLCEYLSLKKHSKLSYAKQQLNKQLEELEEKGIIKHYNFEQDLFEIFINLKLSQSINLWTRYKVSEKELLDIDKLTPLQNKLKEYGLSFKQVRYITEKYKEELIQDKIKQVEYLFSHIPYKVKGAGSYLYNSIINNWIDSEYEIYKQEQKQHELQLLTAQKNKEHEKIVEKYEKYVHDTCINYYKNKISDKDKEQIDEEVQEKLESNTFIQTNKSIKELYEQSTISKVIQERSKELSEFHLLSFQNWQKEQS